MWQDTIKNARILIVDDKEANVLYLETVLRKSGYSEVRSTQGFAAGAVAVPGE